MSQHIPEGERALRVASVPAAHRYVQSISCAARSDGSMIVLDDPLPSGAPADRWWPPVMLDPAWIDAHSDTFDLLHIHFGFESFSAQELEQTVDALHRAHRPLVLSVHDLENPQLGEQHAYLPLLDVLITAADELITLTGGAAAEIDRRWGRAATVIPHPRVLKSAPTPAQGRTSGRAGRAARVGVQLRDLRPNIDALTTVRLLLDAAQRRDVDAQQLTIVVDVNEHVRDEPARAELRRLVTASPFGEWNEHPRLDDDDLAASLASLDIVVLPYRHGTHSGWLELCWDLGVDVLAPDIGFYREQHPDGSVAVFDQSSARSFDHALARLLDRPHEPRETVSVRRLEARTQQSRQICDAHLAVYEHALSRVRA